ncbi:putative 25S rRNA (adenine(645)-N(1))-methyltransferase [Rosa chinensis]|uniref:Ribosomal RNA-processing protein 8 n=2 Tax=Rosa chinensis TaxID=74649 RepID=A0A2P6S5R9_ROSCH|nr:putative 25S rRNA (adenine(645)-N(1))-methyltransferase [Rosa chinensis]
MICSMAPDEAIDNLFALQDERIIKAVIKKKKKKKSATESRMESSKKRKGAKRRRHTASNENPKPERVNENKEEQNPKASKRRKSQGPVSNSSSFLDKMKAKLSGGHFRMLNEKLYTCTGEEALEYFNDDPTLFDTYHAGYQEQMSHWPELPVNIIIKWLKDHSPSLVVADFGCGDARLAKSVKNKVFSFDLISNDPSVISCDMANTPLCSSSVDVAVFCLSLMGTNFPSYLNEAHRILKPRGWLLIAEVKSRFDSNTGGADPKKFTKAVCDLGFTSVAKDFSNKMFILFYFKKKEEQISKKKDIDWPELKPCLYKRR